MVQKIAFTLLLVTAISLSLVACTAAAITVEPTATATQAPAPTEAPASDATAAAEPDPAPAFTLTSMEGETVSLSQFEGEWLILNFWATWCPPCVSEMPYLQSLADRGFNIVGVNVGETAEQVEPFNAEYGIEFPILMNPDINMVLDYQARQLPRTVVIDPEGNIVLRISGPIDGERFDPWLDEHGVE